MKGNQRRAALVAAGIHEPAGQNLMQIAEDDQHRSRFVRHLVQTAEVGHAHAFPSKVPRVLLQFWDKPTAVPADVRECLDSWRPLEGQGFERLLFDDQSAERFIAKYFGRRYSVAFGKCGHPAMRCDYFRLCFIARNGGFYIDADEFYLGGDFEYLFDDNRLKLQPLCYETSTGTMVQAEVFTTKHADSPDWIFYVNNNPIIAPPSHPVIRKALARSTQILLKHAGGKPDIQSTTGPGNLTASLVRHALASGLASGARDFALVPSWEAVSMSRWPLSYRSDERNWRLWSQSP